MPSRPPNLPVTPDGHYFVHGGRLWRCTNPDLKEEDRERLVQDLMRARRAVRAAKEGQDEEALRQARARVHAAKVGLGERGPTWWDDDEAYDRKKPENTPYADWWSGLTDDEREGRA